MPERTATRGLILEAVVTCIEKYGIDKVTTRKIAVEAGTNIASINYYFRSKEELLSEAMSMTIKHMLDDVFMAIDDLAQPFDDMFADVIFYLLDGSHRFPGVSRAHLYQAVVQRGAPSISSRAMARLFDRLAQRAIREFPGSDPKRLRWAVSQVLSSIVLSMLAPELFAVSRDYQPVSPKNARMLATLHLNRFKAML
jgi:TetR/AcrR family transcriptional regulator, regulator of cefoperazone and chloramphenicol sensitivity